MADETDRESKTEEATEKRLKEAVDKGRLPFSREIPVLLGVAATWLAIVFMLADAGWRVAVALRPFWEMPSEWRMASAADGASLLGYVASAALMPLIPILGLIGFAGLIGSLVQSRGFSLDRIRPQASRISPKAGLQRLFGKDGLGHTLKSTIGLILVGAVGGFVLLELLSRSTALFGVESGVLAAAVPALASRLLISMLAAMLIVTTVEATLARFAWRRNMRMSKHEVKEESKDTDGNPQIKLKMRLIARRRLRKQMLAAVPRATVVITNPTHYAVALRYVPGETAAPTVVAKGTDFIALRIREVAVASKVPVIEDQPLARALFAGVEVDAAIPPALYKAVARIILLVDKSAARAATRG